MTRLPRRRTNRYLRTTIAADARPVFNPLEPRRLLTVITPHLIFDPTGHAPAHVGSLNGQGQSAEFLFTAGNSGAAMFDHGGLPGLDSALTMQLYRGNDLIATEDDADGSSSMQASVAGGVEYRLVVRSNVAQSIEYAAAVDLPTPEITSVSVNASGDFDSGVLRFNTATQSWYFSYVAPSSGLIEVAGESDDVRGNGEDFDTDLLVFDASGAEIHRDVDPTNEGRWNALVDGGATYFFLLRQDISGFDTGTFTFKLEGPEGEGGGGGGGNNGAPPALSASPGTVRHGDTLTLLIQNDGHGGNGRHGGPENEFEVRRSWFYRDSNGNGLLDGDDALLGSDFNDDNGFRWVGGVSYTWGTGDVKFFAVIEDSNSSSRTLEATVTIDNSAAAGEVHIYEEDGDDFTLRLSGSSGTLRYETDDHGGISRIILDGEDFSSGRITSVVRRGSNGDGRLSVGSLVGEDGLPIENLRFRNIDLRNIDFTGQGLMIDGADSVRIGSLTGSGSISGNVGRLTLGRVDTDGSFDLGDITSITADSLNVRGGLRVNSVRTIDIKGDGHFDIDAGDDNSPNTINRIRVRGDASGNWMFRGETEVRNVIIDGRGELELTDDHTGRSSVRKITVRGDDDFSSMHIEMEHLERLDIHGGLHLFDDSDIRGLRNLRVRGSFDSGTLDLSGDDSARIRIDGNVSTGSILNVSGGSLDVRGDVEGTINLDHARKADVRGSLAGGTLNFASADSTRLKVRGDVRDGATISAESSMKEIMLGSLLESAIYMGLRNWGGGLPGSLAEFDAPDSILERLTIKGSTSGSTIVAPHIERLDLGRLSDAATTHVAGGTVEEARFTAADNLRYLLRDGSLFENAPDLPYLDLVELT